MENKKIKKTIKENTNQEGKKKKKAPRANNKNKTKKDNKGVYCILITFCNYHNICLGKNKNLYFLNKYHYN